MSEARFHVGDTVRVKKHGEATFQAHGTCRTKGDYKTWVDTPPRPWYPHGQEAQVVKVTDDGVHIYVRTDRDWPIPIPFWCAEVP